MTNEPIELDEFGLAVWRHKDNKTLFAERNYRWCDRIIVLDESVNRRMADDTQFSTFDFSEWIPVTAEEFNRVKACYKEIYE